MFLRYRKKLNEMNKRFLPSTNPEILVMIGPLEFDQWPQSLNWEVFTTNDRIG